MEQLSQSPGCLLVMFCLSRNHGGSSFKGENGKQWQGPSNNIILYMSESNLHPHHPRPIFLNPNHPHPFIHISCIGTTFNSSTVAHISRCQLLRCGQVNASWAKFRRRSMKEASRSSKPPGCNEMLSLG